MKKILLTISFLSIINSTIGQKKEFRLTIPEINKTFSWDGIKPITIITYEDLSTLIYFHIDSLGCGNFVCTDKEHKIIEIGSCAPPPLYSIKEEKVVSLDSGQMRVVLIYSGELVLTGKRVIFDEFPFKIEEIYQKNNAGAPHNN